MAKKPGNVNVNVNVKRIGRKRRAAGWTLLTLGVIVAGVWVASGWWWVAWSPGRWGFELVHGQLRVEKVNRKTPPPAVFDRAPRDGAPIAWFVPRSDRWSTSYFEARVVCVRRFKGDPANSPTYGYVALWPIPLVLWTPAALLLRSGILARRRAVTGSCAKCGYSLAGLDPSTPCPECGRAGNSKV